MTATSADAAAKKKPAVAVTAVGSLPRTVTSAAAFKVPTTVRNATRKTVKATVVYRLSKDKRLDGKDTVLTKATTGKLRPKATKRIKPAVRVPKTLAQGTYYVLACTGSSCKATKTYVLRSDAPPPSSGDRGTLTGTLTFGRTALTDWSGVKDETKVDVAMNYKGPFAVSNDLVNTTSTASYDHLHTRVEDRGGDGCTITTTDATKAATRPLVTTGNLYTDEISGAISDNQLNELHVDLNIEYVYTTTVVKGGATGCPQERTVSTHKSWDLMTVELAKASRSGSDITYDIKRVYGSMYGSVSWKDITGALTLHLG